MNRPAPLLAFAGWLLRRRNSGRGRTDPEQPRILVIRRNRMGDMLYTLPLLHLLRRHFSKAQLVVACDAGGAPIARACAAVDEVVVLKPGWSRWISAMKNASRLQDCDWVIAAKGGFDRRLATLARLTNGAMRIGFERQTNGPSRFYTHPVALPPDPHAEHQIETVLRLLRPLGVEHPVFLPEMLRLRIPAESGEFAERILTEAPFAGAPSFALINISCNRPVKFEADDYAAAIRRLLEATSLAVGIVSDGADRAAAQALAGRFPAERCGAVATPGVLDLAALLERAALFLTPEGGAAHLSSATGTPTVVLWSGHYGKWRPRGERHVLVEAAADEPRIPVNRVGAALESLLGAGTVLPS